MATKEELKARIIALEKAKLDASEERAQLDTLEQTPEAKALPKPAVPAPTSKSLSEEEYDDLDILIDQGAFESGGQGMQSPSIPDVYDGYFIATMRPNNKPEQLWWVFRTDDARVRAQLGRDVRSAIITVPKGAGGFKVNDILTGLGVAFDNTEAGRVKARIPKGLHCKLDFAEVVIDGKTQVRLQNVWTGEVPQAV